MLSSHNRYKYSGIDTRPRYRWPGGKSLAVYVALNAEHFPFGAPGGIDLDRETKPWSQRSWLWREYGNRVGGWRLAALFDDLALNVGLIINAESYEHCPDLVARFRARGDEMIGHGLSNGTERPIDMDEATERGMVRDVTAAMLAADGVKPVGWLSPYLTPSLVTTDLLVENGYEYLLDWGICDEQPFWVKGGGGRILSIPYPIELNDQPAIVGRRHTPAEYADSSAPSEGCARENNGSGPTWPSRDERRSRPHLRAKAKTSLDSQECADLSVIFARLAVQLRRPAGKARRVIWIAAP